MIVLDTNVVSEVMRRRRSVGLAIAFRAMLLIGMLLVGATGHLGGKMVFGDDHFAFND